MNIAKAEDFNSEQLKKLDEAKLLWERVWNSDKFREEVLNFRYTYTTGSLCWKKTRVQYGFRWNDGMNTEQIFDKLMSGAELLAPQPDNEADLQITLYVANNSTVGYTYPGTMMQWVNGKFFNSYTAADVAGNLSHEYCHKLGFDHEYRFSSLRQFTVPYAIGYMTANMAAELMRTPALEAAAA